MWGYRALDSRRLNRHRVQCGVFSRTYLLGVIFSHLMSLTTFFKEKDFENRVYAFEFNGMHHTITTDVVIEAIKKSQGTERQRIIAILQKLDFMNGDFHHFFQHCAKGLAARY